MGDHLFWRALFMALFIGILLIARYGSQTASYIAVVGLPGVLAGAFLTLSFVLFILSVMRTTVANSLILMSTAPFVAALFGRIFLHEHVPRRTVIAIAIGLVGIALMLADAFGSSERSVGISSPVGFRSLSERTLSSCEKLALLSIWCPPCCWLGSSLLLSLCRWDGLSLLHGVMLAYWRSWVLFNSAWDVCS
jgi:drug/metabolite transporter (DMT)-like permease